MIWETTLHSPGHRFDLDLAFAFGFDLTLDFLSVSFIAAFFLASLAPDSVLTRFDEGSPRLPD
jgi:hypothetical protein